MNKLLKEIEDLEEFLDADLPSKIFPEELICGTVCTREDHFKNEKEVRDYIKLHFDILREELEKEK